MLRIAKARSLPQAYLFFGEATFAEFSYMTRKLLLVVFGKQNPVVKEYIATNADAHVCRANIIVAVNLDMIVTRENSHGNNADNAEDGFVLMAKNNVINKPRVMRKTSTDILPELVSKIGRATAEVGIVFGRLSRNNAPLDILGGPISEPLRIGANIEEPHGKAVEVGKIQHTENLRHLNAERSPLQIRVNNLEEHTLQLARLNLAQYLPFENGMIHKRKIMVSIHRQIVSHLTL